MSSSSSSDFETNVTQKIAQKKKKTVTKKKTKPKAVVVAQTDEHGKNEGDDPHWAYEPPEGAVLVDHDVDAGPFEWDTIQDDEDIEIWLIRVPDSIKPKYLEGLEIDPPSSSRTARVGGLTKKHTSYDVWSVGDDDTDVAGAEELRGLTCLLPRKSNEGKLYIAPKQVSRHIVISAQPSIATAPEQPTVYRNPPRASYSKDVLKHAFVPYGARSEQTQSQDATMDVDDDIDTTVEKSANTEPTPKEKPTKTKESKGKKRKVEGESPKKSKKHKAHT